MKKLLINPLFIYSMGFSISLLLYNLKWSELYPILSDELLIFLIGTILFGFFLSFFLNLFIKDNERDIKISKINSYTICFFITLGFCLEYLYSKQIPTLWVLLGLDSNYKEFGIPTFHVFLLPYASIFSIISFFRFIKNKQCKYFLYSSIYTIFLISTIMNRAALLIIFMAIGLIFLYYRFSIKFMFLLSFVGVIILYGFGIMGNKRMISSGYQDELAILNIANASDEFRNNLIPNEFFWGYLYSTVSIANLENQVMLHSDKGVGNFSDLILFDVFPDFISKRLYTDDDIERYQPDLIKNELTTSTMFGRSIKIFGTYGAIVIYIWFVFFCFLSLLFTSSRYRIPVLSLLCVIGVLSIFSNMMVFSGTLLQIILAILFLPFSNRKLGLL